MKRYTPEDKEKIILEFRKSKVSAVIFANSYNISR